MSKLPVYTVTDMWTGDARNYQLGNIPQEVVNECEKGSGRFVLERITPCRVFTSEQLFGVIK